MSNELKPCPFCGEKAIMKIEKHIPSGYDYTPTCRNPSCAGRLTKKWTNEAVAIEAWNSRAERTAKATKFEPCSKSYWATDGRCEGCGGYLERMYKYCPECGAKLDWSEK